MNPKDPQAELPDKEQLVFAWRQYNDEDITFEEAEADIDRYLQAHQQELLSEILGELSKLRQDEHPTEDGAAVETYGYEATHNQAIDQVVEILTSKIGELNGRNYGNATR